METMNISSLTFVVTDDCNFNCSYCFQNKEKKTISHASISTAVDFFYPFLNPDNANIGFYGGEPLLAFDKIEQAVLSLINKNNQVSNQVSNQDSNKDKNNSKKLKFSVTTNGSLLTETILEFFNQHHFTLVLSFDGLAQDFGRKKGSLDNMLELIKKIQSYPNIHFEINSVFAPDTIDKFADSIRFIIQLGGPEVRFNISTIQDWKPSQRDTLKKELARLVDFLVPLYNETGKMPVKNYRFSPGKDEGNKSIFSCGGGFHRMAVTPDDMVWGCFLFHDFFKTRKDHPQYNDFSFGTLSDFIVRHEILFPETLAHYADLRQDYFQVKGGDKDFCFLCEDLESCKVCPVNAAYAGGAIGKVSCGRCHLIKIQAEARNNFRRGIEQD